MAYLALSVTGVMHGIWIKTLKLVWREEDASLLAFDLCKEVLLLVVMCWRHIAYGERILIENVICGKKTSVEGPYYPTLRSRNCAPYVRTLTLHANEQQVGCQLPPAPLGLLLVDPVPVETKEVNNNLLPYCVIQGLLQIYPWNARGKRRAKCMSHFVLHSETWNKSQRSLFFISAINASAGDEPVYKVLLFVQAASPLNHKEQCDIKGSGHCKSK